ncbi:MAG: HAMP domain-containing histidine kinase [Clostridia bacterium]|nr:HAMP domain-containing histidine kinase [Clostridia bacterium]
MKLFRNPEVIRSLAVQLTAAAVFTLIAYFIDLRFCYLTAAMSVCFITISLITTYKRYKAIYLLSSDIDRILHGDAHVNLSSYSEGELAVLSSEIYKMTIRLREQSDNLKKDKVFLADSIADISHQIRTPLTSINLLISLLKDDISEEKRAKLSHELYELLSRIEWLITTLLKISKIDAGTVNFKSETIPLQTLIDKSAAPLLIPAELRSQEIRINCNGYFTGDLAWSSEALCNIIKNCTEHTPNGGIIEIEGKETSIFSEIIIKDNGKGIAEEDLANIFKRFYKGKNSDTKSFGIGLNLARMIITEQNGTVKAENNPEGGAKFTVRFYKGTV